MEWHKKYKWYSQKNYVFLVFTKCIGKWTGSTFPNLCCTKLFKVDSEHQFHAVMLKSKLRLEFSGIHFRFHWIKVARLKNIARYDCPNFRKVECLFNCNYSCANVTFSAKLASKRLILRTLLKCVFLKLQALYLGMSSLQRCKTGTLKMF